MRSTTLAVLLLPAILLLSSCAAIVPLEPADDAVNPSCAEVSVHLPESVANLDSRETNAQATGAWGEPASIILRCGVPVPPPTAEFACVPVDGIEWLRDDSNDPTFVFTTYGRDPAVEVIIDGTVASGLEVLTDLSDAVGALPKNGRECVSLGDLG